MEIFGKEMTSPEFWPASLLLQLGRSFYGPEEAAMHHPPFCDGDSDEDLYIIGAVCGSVGHKSDYFAVSPKRAYK